MDINTDNVLIQNRQTFISDKVQKPPKYGLQLGEAVLYEGEKRYVCGHNGYYGVYVRKENGTDSQLVLLFQGKLSKLIFD